ncbi:hypothetical protein BC937DRAFT_89473, partial [Endogone sp. FLAS-F59071]
MTFSSLMLPFIPFLKSPESLSSEPAQNELRLGRIQLNSQGPIIHNVLKILFSLQLFKFRKIMLDGSSYPIKRMQKISSTTKSPDYVHFSHGLRTFLGKTVKVA